MSPPSRNPFGSSFNDAELREVVAALGATPLGEQARDALREATARRALAARGNPEGTCGHGQRVYADQTGAYSSGYICHVKGHNLCEGGMGLNVIWDEREPFDVYLRRLGLA